MATAATASAQGKQAPPRLMLWSWNTEDDFRPLLDHDTGVGYLGLSISLEGKNEVTASPRRIPVRIAPETYQMLVIRFDYQSDAKPAVAFSQKQRQLAVRMVAEMYALARTKAVQIDFDAPQSAWTFYRQVLTDIRDRIGPDVFLSATALVSWCDSAQSWMSGLPVDEIVPMAFYMGQAGPSVMTMLNGGGQFAFAGCRTSLYLALCCRASRGPTSTGSPLLAGARRALRLRTNRYLEGDSRRIPNPTAEIWRHDLGQAHAHVVQE
jgi:hypothetical protein